MFSFSRVLDSSDGKLITRANQLEAALREAVPGLVLPPSNGVPDLPGLPKLMERFETHGKAMEQFLPTIGN